MTDIIIIIENISATVGEFVWSGAMMLLMLGTGIYLGIKTRFFLRFRPSFIWKNTFGSIAKSKRDDSSVSPFEAVTTALAGTVGVGNIAGVAGAIALGGPGVIFWMWISAIIGMVTKYSEILLAVKFRRKATGGGYYGGPMYYMEEGVGSKALAVVFSVLGGITCFGIGNMAQASEFSGSLCRLTGFSPFTSGIILAAILGFVIFGGIKKIGKVTSIVVPVMAVFYLLCGTAILFVNHDRLVPAFAEIFKSALNLKAAGGGIFGAAMQSSMRYGIARGIFSNEAGLGSAPIAHAASNTNEPVLQAVWGIFEVFADTIVMCTLTGLIILVSGLNIYGTDVGGALTAKAFEQALPCGGVFIRISILLFAFSSILSWSYYGQQCWLYITRDSPITIKLFQSIFLLAAVAGSMGGLKLMWEISDSLNGLMAIPNLIALIILSDTVRKTTAEFFNRQK